jgi:hypothetical protein
MGTTPPTFPVSKASFYSNTYTFDPLYASDTISQSANIAGGLNAAGTVLPRGTVLCGPLQNIAVTTATLLTTVVTGATARFILAADIDTSAGQVTGLVYSQGKFLDTAMTFTSQGAALDVAQLWDFGIYVLTVEQRSGMLVPMMKLPATGGPLPQSLSAKDAKAATEEEVKAIQAAAQASRPQSFAAPPPRGVQPAWASAAFGEPKPTAAQQAEEKAAEQADELAQKQTQEFDKLKADQSKAMSDLAQKQEKEREQLDKQSADAISKAQQQQNADAKPPAKSPVVPGTH